MAPIRPEPVRMWRPDHDVFQRRHLGEQPDVLEGARNAGLGHFMHRGGLWGLPASSKLPLSGVYRPVITLKNVVLPAPLGPIRPRPGRARW